MYPVFSFADSNVSFCSSDMGPCYHSEKRGYLRNYRSPASVLTGAVRGVMCSTDNGRRFESVNGPWQPKLGAMHPGTV